jgi:hypothetical protein
LTLEVIGVGLHRTGTLSIKVALERLGIGPVYHGFEYLGRPDQIPYWQEAMENGGEGVDWRRIFGEYRAAFDWPMIHFWEEVVAAYPNARVLLTDRDPESWYASHAEGLQSIFQRGEAGTMPATPESRDIIVRTIFTKFSDRPFEKDHAIGVFNRHYARVRATVPPDRLLVYRAAEGWEPLCRFLGVDVPDEPFPRVNARAAFADNAYRAIVRTRQKTEGMDWL